MYMRRHKIITFLLLYFYTTSTCVSAQTLPGSADPSRFDERFNIVTPENDETIVAPEMLIIDETIPEAQQTGFVLKDVTISGVTVFNKSDMNVMIDEYIGREVDFTVLNHLTSRITNFYRHNGYFLSKAVIPAQTISDGNVRIHVIEGHVSQVIVNTNEPKIKKSRLIAETVARLEKDQALHGPTLERHILLLNEGAGVSMQSVLAPASDQTRPGQVDIILKPEPKKPWGALSYNNHGSKFVGPHQLIASYGIGGILNPFDSLIVQGTTSLPLQEVQYGALSYAFPINALGLTSTTSFSYSNSDPGYTLAPLEVESDSYTFETGLSYPIVRSRKENLKIGVDFSLRNNATEFLDEELIDDKTRTIKLNASYDVKDDEGHVTASTIVFHKGLEIFGSSENGAPTLSRAQGRVDYFKAEMTAARLQRLSSYFDFLGQVNAQYAPHPLLSVAEFGYGGASMGRAYDPSEITGDSGVSASAELRFHRKDVKENVIHTTPFVFYDIGKVWNHDRNEKPISASSAGIGTYFQFYDIPVSGSLQAALPLTKDVDNPVMGGVDGPRVLFEINVSF